MRVFNDYIHKFWFVKAKQRHTGTKHLLVSDMTTTIKVISISALIRKLLRDGQSSLSKAVPNLKVVDSTHTIWSSDLNGKVIFHTSNNLHTTSE